MPDQVRSSHDSFTFKAYRGDGAALLAFDLDESYLPDLAGFAVEYTTPDGKSRWLQNRLSFADPLPASATAAQRKWFPTSEAPLQTFRWAHFPRSVERGIYRYRAVATLFKKGSEDELKEGPEVTVDLELDEDDYSDFDLGFTRGYLSSQAYAELFDNKEIRPSGTSLLFDTGPFERQYRWLGFRARRMLFEFLRACIEDPDVSVDVFAYDLDEPEVVRKFEQLGSRLRLFLDDSERHAKRGAREVAARKLIERSAGKGNVKTGHFHRFSHNKVLVARRDGTPWRVLTGSANFSVRGLYVQANSMLLFEDAQTARLYADAFDQAWADPKGFRDSPIAAEWFGVNAPSLPRSSISFAPHRVAEVSLDVVADAIAGADSSVLFSVMDLGGTGRVLEQLRALAREGKVLSLGMTQSLEGSLKIQRPGRQRGEVVPFAYLSKQVPAPFRKEWSGGAGQVIHHKFVVVDFNGTQPVVFTGSSNLAAGGEKANSDNLLAISDRSIATAYAVEAVRLFDHYRFRSLMKDATGSRPLRLKTRSERWWKKFYDERDIRRRERLLFVS